MTTERKQKIKPLPLFDTIKVFLDSTEKEYLEDRPGMVAYIRQFEPDILAMNDFEQVRAFLKSYSGFSTTFNNYRVQVERLMLWAWIKREKSLLALNRTDAEAFMNFTASPDPSWVGQDEVVQRFVQKNGLYVQASNWRPFKIRISKAMRMKSMEDATPLPNKVFEMSQGSIKQVFAACSTFYDWLNKQNVSVTNPFKAIKQKSAWTQRSLKVRTGRALTNLQWDYIIETAELMADEDPKHERSLFIVATLYGLYLRVSDIVGNPKWKPTMGSFEKKGENWWYNTVGKGNVSAQITVKPDYLKYLVRYRRTRSLPDFPAPGETTSLLASVTGRAGLKGSQIRNMIQEVFDAALARMLEDGRTEEEIAAVRSASAHWLRHTGATFDAKYRDPKHLQLDLRHKDLATTQNIYYNSIDEERAKSVSGLKMRPDG